MSRQVFEVFSWLKGSFESQSRVNSLLIASAEIRTNQSKKKATPKHHQAPSLDERRAAMSANFLQTVIASATTSEAQVFTLGAPPYRIVHVNTAWTRLCGFSASEAIGQTCKIMQGPATEREALGKLHALLWDRKPARVRLTNYTKKLVPFVFELLVTPLTDELGNVSHFVGTMRVVGEAAPGPKGQKQAVPTSTSLAHSAITAAFLARAPTLPPSAAPSVADGAESESGSSRAGQSPSCKPLLSFPLHTLNSHPIAPVLLRMLQVRGTAALFPFRANTRATGTR